MNLSISYEVVENVSEGEVFKFEGKKYKLDRKRKTAVAITRYYWWEAAYDYLSRLTKKKQK